MAGNAAPPPPRRPMAAAPQASAGRELRPTAGRVQAGVAGSRAAGVQVAGEGGAAARRWLGREGQRAGGARDAGSRWRGPTRWRPWTGPGGAVEKDGLLEQRKKMEGRGKKADSFSSARRHRSAIEAAVDERRHPSLDTPNLSERGRRRRRSASYHPPPATHHGRSSSSGGSPPSHEAVAPSAAAPWSSRSTSRGMQGLSWDGELTRKFYSIRFKL
uniref:Uncharacterized protein n=1 Tax=Setaria viridis TaxID=4556 RepID=A0A4U6W793_SETVI|nr:hypothetical protein SEVIR_1G121300v2 [Setaria viridis]